MVLTRPGARCVGLAEAGQLGRASLRAYARSMNAREYTPRSRSRSALARHLHEREVRWRPRRVGELRRIVGRLGVRWASPSDGHAAHESDRRRQEEARDDRSSHVRPTVAWAAASTSDSGASGLPSEPRPSWRRRRRSGPCARRRRGRAAAAGSPIATPVTATVPSRARWSSSSQRSWRTTCAPSTASTRRVAGPDSRPTTETQAGRSPARSARGAAGAASRGVVWPAAEPSLTTGTPRSRHRIPQPGGHRGRARRAGDVRASIARRATLDDCVDGDQACAIPEQPTDPHLLPRTDNDGRADPKPREVARSRGRRASRSDRRMNRPTRSPPEPASAPPAEPLPPATGAVTRTSERGAWPDSVALVRLRTAGLLADHSAHLDPGASARANRGRRAGELGDTDAQGPAAVVDLERDRPARPPSGGCHDRAANDDQQCLLVFADVAGPDLACGRLRRRPKRTSRLRDAQRFHAAERRTPAVHLDALAEAEPAGVPAEAKEDRAGFVLHNGRLLVEKAGRDRHDTANAHALCPSPPRAPRGSE